MGTHCYSNIPQIPGGRDKDGAPDEGAQDEAHGVISNTTPALDAPPVGAVP
jgi:hypothetical protein